MNTSISLILNLLLPLFLSPVKIDFPFPKTSWNESGNPEVQSFFMKSEDKYISSGE